MASLPSRQPESACDDHVAGLTAWSDANFAGFQYQYNVGWNTCSKKRRRVLQPWESKSDTKDLVSMASQFPYNKPAGVSSIAANSFNWCTVYP